jgi:hypothetical protein
MTRALLAIAVVWLAFILVMAQPRVTPAKVIH